MWMTDALKKYKLYCQKRNNETSICLTKIIKNKQMNKSLCLLLGITLFLTSCQDEVVLPKPRAYPRVFYPEKKYHPFHNSDCPLSFEYPVYTEIKKDKEDAEEQHPCWFNIHYPDYDASIHCTYRPIDGLKDYEKARADAFRMAGWHNKKATYIDDIPIENERGVKGMLFNMKGPSASPIQFFLSDEEKHFFRGSLYFNTHTRPDSLAPVIDFIKADVLKLLETFEWRE